MDTRVDSLWLPTVGTAMQGALQWRFQPLSTLKVMAQEALGWNHPPKPESVKLYTFVVLSIRFWGNLFCSNG